VFHIQVYDLKKKIFLI